MENIKSTDIDPTKFTFENLVKIRAHFNTDPEDTIDDSTFARYLIARNNDLALAIDQLERVRLWRSLNTPIEKDSVALEMAKQIIYPHGFDKEGHPLLIVNPRNIIIQERDMKTLAMMAIYLIDYMIKTKMPDNKSKFTIMLDRSSVKENDLEFIKKFNPIFKDLYAERIYTVLAHPSGMVFYAVYNIIKWFLDPNTRDKVRPILYQVGLEDFVNREFISKTIGGDCDFVFKAEDMKEFNYNSSPVPSSALATAKNVSIVKTLDSVNSNSSEVFQDTFFSMSREDLTGSSTRLGVVPFNKSVL